jgi:Domain of unknown function DUF11
MSARPIVVAAVAIIGLALAPSASADLVVTQTASPKPVKKGELVTVTVTVTNPGPRPVDSETAQVEMFPLRGSSHEAADNPYESVTASSGTCALNPTGAYHVADCFLGEFAVGATAQIVAVLRVNESMTHSVGPKVGTPTELGIAASTPPLVTGASRLRLAGLPTGCVAGDFRLTVTANARNVREVVATLNLGYNDVGDGVTWRRAANGRRLTATVPASGIFEPRMGRVYRLRIRASRRGGPALRRTVAFELCG